MKGTYGTFDESVLYTFTVLIICARIMYIRTIFFNQIIIHYADIVLNCTVERASSRNIIHIIPII